MGGCVHKSISFQPIENSLNAFKKFVDSDGGREMIVCENLPEIVKESLVFRGGGGNYKDLNLSESALQCLFYSHRRLCL